MSQKIKEVLMKLGMSPKLKGYRYIVTSVELLTKWGRTTKSMTLNLYPEVGKIHGTSATSVERAIRYAIEDTWLKGSYSDQADLFGSFISADKGKPTNSDLLYALVVFSEEEK